jgi:chromosome partitioning protein
MARTIALMNEKGGTGKTTTAVNLAHALARQGAKVLLVDLDPQGNATQHLGVEFTKSTYHLIATPEHLATCFYNARKNLDVVPANKNLFAAELAILTQPGRELVLKNKLRPAASTYDFVLVDCAPSLSVLTHNALACSSEVMVPVAMDYLSLAGLESVQRTVSAIRQALNHEVQIVGIIPTLFHGRLRASQEILNTMKARWDGNVLPTIRTCSKLREAPKHRMTIFEHAPTSRGAQDYETLARKITTMEVRRHENDSRA